MKLIEVTTRQHETDFLKVHTQINQGNPNWIRPLDKDVRSVFDPQQNKTFKSGEAIRWILTDEAGKTIGRIAAFVNRRYKNKGDDVKVGGIGFFECIDQQQAANVLFEKAKQWLQDRGMEAMDGPINFGERDKWWGLLVSGFDPPLYTMNYNPPYYQNLFETYGFQNFFNQICWRMSVAAQLNQLQPKFYEAHQNFSNNPDFQAVHLKKSQLRKFASDFSTVYNKAWSKHEGNKEISSEQAYRLFKSMEPIVDEKLIWFTYQKGEPIAMWINIPDLNQLVAYLNGQFNAWAKLKFMALKYWGVCTRFVGLVYGIVPEWQGTGIDYFMIVEAEKVIKASTRYREVELQWQGDFNPKMLNISRNLGAEQSRVLVTYRYLFDREKPFHRHPILA
ncbi:hypothetical protein ACO2Q8_11240 [Larkinella sp. VNQ87]|uniref:hypothetical protein n=1 Tax=Larkinella sp. VNQ87 TaxID=3400921 RepID=UPI003C0A9C35